MITANQPIKGKRGRSRDWNEGLAEDLHDREFARRFILAAIAEGLSIQVVLGKVVRAYGLKEFAQEIGMPSGNLSRALNPRHNPTQQTLDRILAPFGLQLSVAPIHPARKLKVHC